MESLRVSCRLKPLLVHPEITFVVPVTPHVPDLQCVRVIPQLWMGFASAVKASLELLQPKSPSPGSVSAASKALWVAVARGLAEDQLGWWQLMVFLSLGGDFFGRFLFRVGSHFFSPLLNCHRERRKK